MDYEDVYKKFPEDVRHFAYRLAEADHDKVSELNKARASGSRLRTWWVLLRLRIQPDARVLLQRHYAGIYSKEEIDRLYVWAVRVSL